MSETQSRVPGCDPPSNADPSGGRDLSAALRNVLRGARVAHDQSIASVLDTLGLRAELAEPRSGSGRYVIEREIAHGGVGVILKGHDVDLGREVAIKVLHERHRHDPALLSRFVEEAQIGGQLQHPGVVPVYEIGLYRGSPFFAMKLIEGQTLAKLLSERVDGSGDTRKFLEIFQQVSLTMAYAHARGVIHRDLKPTNVMVGAFGEVQVVDWGFAKVLGHAACPDAAVGLASTRVATVRSQETLEHSMPGSVMGTPAYMAPEQARGEIDKLDERSDVFALGSILCEILTGAPAYRGTREQVLDAATRADLGDAHARVQSAAVAADLRALCLQCLQPAIEARPRDAAAVVSRVVDHLASAEKRAEEGRMQAFAARKSQRLTLALAGSVLVTVLVGGGAWVWMTAQADAWRARVESDVAAHLRAADELRGRALASQGAASLQAFTGALAAIKEAEARAASAEASDAVRREVAERRGILEREHAGAAAASARRSQQQELVQRLEEARIPGEDDLREQGWTEVEAARLDRVYGDAWRGYGIDVEALDEQAALGRLQGEHALFFASALDHHAAQRRRMRPQERPAFAQLFGLARLLDDDPIRNGLRDALARADRDASTLADMTGSIRRSGAAAATYLLLGHALREVGDPAGAMAVYCDGQAKFSTDLALAFYAGLACELQERPEWGEAARYYTAAVALRPGSFAIWRRLAGSLDHVGQTEAAAGAENQASARMPARWLEFAPSAPETSERIAGLRELVGRAPDDAGLHIQLGKALLAGRNFDEAVTELERAVQIDARSALGHYLLGDAWYGKRRFDEARIALRASIRLDQKFSKPHKLLGDILLQVGDIEGAVHELEAATACDPEWGSAWSRLGDALMQKGEHERGMEALLRGVAKEPRAPWVHNSLGNGYQRLKEGEQAIRAYRAAIRADAKFAVAYSNLGNVLVMTGDLRGGIEALQKAVDLQPTYADAHCNLGHALRKDRQFAEALAANRKAIALRPDHAEAHCNIAGIYDDMGDSKEALRWIRKGHELGSKRADWAYPSARWVRETEAAAEREEHLTSILDGTVEAASAEECVEAIGLAAKRQLFLAAAHAWTKAFARFPSLEGEYRKYRRYLAGQAAAHAGCGEGLDVEKAGEAERAQLRCQSLAWFRAELVDWTSASEGSAAAAALEAECLTHWLGSPDLEHVRSPQQLALLPEGERAQWEAFWHDVAGECQRAKSR